MENQFKFFIPTKIIFDYEATSKLKEYISGSKALAVVDPFLYESGIAQKIMSHATSLKIEYFFEVEPNPSCESVDKAAKLAREFGADCIVGIGGGSAMDVSKMVACLATNEGSIYDYYSGGTRTLSKRQMPLLCIPTTAGTGSEVTNVGVFTNKKTGVKMPFVTDEFWPDVALVDPALTGTLPAAVTASTGMDAFCHAIEAYWNKQSQPMCDYLSMCAVKLVLENIKEAYDNPSNMTARTNMMKASLIAGVSFSQTRTTGIHAVSFPLTAEFGANHGTACAVTLPAFIRVSKEQAGEKMQALANYLGYSDVDELADAVEKLMVSINMPIKLSGIGVKKSDLEHITQVGLSAAIIHLTPAVMNEKTVYNLLKSIL